MTAPEDQQAIEELLASYAQAVDERRFGDAGDLLTEDCVLEVAGAYRDTGRAAIRERQEQRVRDSPAPTRHEVGEVQVAGDGEERGVTSRFTFAEITDEGPVPRAAGRYEDRVVRTGGGWRLAARLIVPDAS